VYAGEIELSSVKAKGAVLEVTEHDYTLMRYLDDVVDGDAALLGRSPR
jgi:DNA-directed RNA polymerase subunit L